MDCWKSISWLAVDDTYSNCMKKKIPSPFASSSARIRSWSVRGLLKEITAPQSFFFFLFFSQNRKPVVFVVVVFLSSLFPFWWCPFLFSHFSGRIGSDSTQPGGNVGSTGGKEMANLLQPEKGEIQRERWEKGEEEEEEEKRRWRLLHATKDVSPASSSSFFRSIFYSNRIFSRPGHHQKTLLSFAWLPLTFQSLHPLPILQFIFIPSKVNKKEKRERVKIKKKLAFPSVYRRTSLALFSLLVNISNQDASSGRVSYFTFFFDIGFLFFSLWLSLLLCFGQQRWTPYRGRKGKVNDDTRAGVSSILRMRRKSFLFLKSCSFFVI